MVKLTGVLSQIQPKRILVAGDLMLDTYTIGKARRISPEAPVAVVHVQKEEHRPGGAGNVILNLVSLGSKVVALGRVGRDLSGKILLDALKQEKVAVEGIFEQENFFTPIKNRILSDNQQIVRIDHETVLPLDEVVETQIINKLPSLLQEIDLVAISDYGKGFLSKNLLKQLISLANKKKIPVITDPKGIDFAKYNGTTILKPNLGEALAAANATANDDLTDVSRKLFNYIDAKTLMITRSEAGISLYHQNGEQEHFAVKKREVKDVTGAGDTVLATLAAALANGLSLSVATQLSNVAAGMAIERFGCARITLSELARRLLKEDVGNKVFDEEHIFALRESLRGTDFALLNTSSKVAITSIFPTIQQMKQEGKELVIQITDEDPDEGFINLLASIHAVDFILVSQTKNLF